MTSLQEFWDTRYEHFNLRESGNLGYSSRYNKWYYRAKKRILDDALRRHVGVLEGKHIVDMGAGTGFFIDYFLRRNAGRVLGIDISEKSANHLARRFASCTNIDIRRLDITADSVSLQEKFHIANVYDLFYLIVDDQSFSRAVRNTCSMVSDGGTIFIVDMFPPRETMIAEYIKCRPLQAYKEALSKEGVEIQELIPQFFLMNRDRRSRLLYYLQKALPELAYYTDALALSMGLHGDGNRSGASFKLMVAKKSS
ncbi:MAG TPA: methyltransferase domain-containing protein [Bacteroidota bacterium]|nr:methyltransferase domain-containing protein [Bacteroidota bacterium]